MGKKCKSCSSGVSGIESIPYMLIGGSIAAAFVAEKVDTMLTTKADGTPKTNDDGTPAYLVANPKIKDAGFLAAGVAATMYADGNEIITGIGLGAAVWGGYNLIKGLTAKATTSGLGYVPPANLGAIHVPGNAGYSPSNIGYSGRMNIPHYQQPVAQPQGSSTIAAGM